MARGQEFIDAFKGLGERDRDKIFQIIERNGIPEEEQKAFINQVSQVDYDRGTSAIFYADTAEAVQTLIELGAEVNLSNRWGITPLHVAIDEEAAQLLINAGAKLNAPDHKGRTPLHHTIITNLISPKIVDVLIAAGADPNVPDLFGETPLDLAKRHGRQEAIEALEKVTTKKHPAPDPDAVLNYLNHTIPDMYSQYQLSRRNGGDFNETPTDSFIKYPQLQIKPEELELIAVAQRLCAAVDAYAHDNNILHFTGGIMYRCNMLAIDNSEVLSARAAFEEEYQKAKGQDIAQKDFAKDLWDRTKEAESKLNRAVYGLGNMGVEPEVVTAFKNAVMQGDSDGVRRSLEPLQRIVEEDLQKGDWLKFYDDKYNPAELRIIYEAIELNGMKEAAAPIFREIGNSALLHRRGSEEYTVVQTALQIGADPNIHRPNGVPLLLSTDEEIIAQMLVKAGADVRGKYGSDQETALHANIWKGWDAWKAVVAAGADVNAQDARGRAPAHVCSQASIAEFIKECQKGNLDLDLNHKDNDGRTPLFAFLTERFTGRKPKLDSGYMQPDGYARDTLKEFITAGARIGTDNQGRTAFDIISEKASQNAGERVGEAFTNDLRSMVISIYKDIAMAKREANASATTMQSGTAQVDSQALAANRAQG